MRPTSINRIWVFQLAALVCAPAFIACAVQASIPLPFGDRYGAWALYAGVAGLFLGDNTSEFNGGSNEELIGTIGLQVYF